MDTECQSKICIEIEISRNQRGVRLLRGIADLLADIETEGSAESADTARPTNSGATGATNNAPTAVPGPEGDWDLEKVRRDALGGESRVWRPMLRYLAERRGQWVYWQEICSAMNRTPNQMAGAIGAAERRCGKPKPYEKRHDGTDYQFRMPEIVAAVIDEVLGD